MTAKLITRNDVYYGTAVEIQAITTANPGAKGFATDTSVWYTTIDGSTWVSYSSGGGGDATLANQTIIKTNLGDMSGDNLISVKAKLGNDTVDVATRLAALLAAVGLTTFTQKTAVATAVNGTTWKTLYDGSTITKLTKIYGWTMTQAGAWAGTPIIRITDAAGNVIFPFQGQYVIGTDFASGVQLILNTPVVIPIANGYKVQFKSSNGADGAGQTVAINNLDVVEVG